MRCNASVEPAIDSYQIWPCGRFILAQNPQVTRENHWVPQGYLKRWTYDPARTKVRRTNTETGEIESKPIKKVPVRAHLYAPMGPDGRRSDPLEKKLSMLERWFGEPVWDHVCCGSPDLTNRHMRMMLSLLLASSFLRTPRHFEQWKTVHQNLVTFVETESIEHGLPDFLTINGQRTQLDAEGWGAFTSRSEEELKKGWNDWVGDAAGLATELMKLRWSMLISETSSFITSDDPVVITDGDGVFRGIPNTETRVIYPLCPTRILMMDHKKDEPEGAYYGVEDGGASVNAHIWRNAFRDVFTHRHPNESP